VNIRRTIAATAAAILVAGSLTLGVVGPASAEPPIVIPDCGHMMTGADWAAAFSAINGHAAVAFTPARPLYGSDKPVLKAFLRSWGATNCSWHLADSGVNRNFTVSMVHMNSYSDRLLRRWMANHGITGDDNDAVIGGTGYQVNEHERCVLIHGRVWVTIVERDTSVFGYTLQSAVEDVAVLNPWIYSGTE